MQSEIELVYTRNFQTLELSHLTYSGGIFCYNFKNGYRECDKQKNSNSYTFYGEFYTNFHE